MGKGLSFGGGAGATAAAGAAGGGGLFGGLFGKSGSQASYDMTSQLLQAAMAGAQGADSPLLAFLTPIAATMIGKRNEKLHADYMKGESDAAATALLGAQAADPRVKSYLDVLSSETAPDALKTVAGAMLKKAIDGSPFGQTTSRRRSGSAAPAASTGSGRLVGEVWIDGVLHGRDRNGTLRPYQTEDGRTATRGARTSASDPLGLNGSTPNDDPLGIR